MDTKFDTNDIILYTDIVNTSNYHQILEIWLSLKYISTVYLITLNINDITQNEYNIL